MNMSIKDPSSGADSTPDLDPIFRMPALLGAAPGPRNMPKSQRAYLYDGDATTLSIRALTDEKKLTALLPQRCRLAGEPTLTVTYTLLTNLGWLAGRGYNILKVQSEIVFEGVAGPVRGNLNWVLWESHADPVITGRDELGMPKLFAHLPDIRFVGDTASVRADWEGHPFFDLTAHGLVKDETATDFESYVAQPGLPALCYRYHPRVGDWRQSDIASMTMSTAGSAPPPVVKAQYQGAGEFRFFPARWEDMPTQYTYVNTLAALPLLEFQPVKVSVVSGIGDLAAMVTIS